MTERASGRETSTCHEVREELSPYADAELSLERELAIGAHLARCVGCSAALETVRALRAAVRDARPEDTGEGLAALRDRLAREGGRSPAPATGWRAVAAAVLLAAGVGLGWAVVERGGRDGAPPGAAPGSTPDDPGTVVSAGLTQVTPEDLSPGVGQLCYDPADCGLDALLPTDR
jgi:hypothetical protein